ncbi:MAG: cadherin-like beta sandwich domain-containing protein [Eubacteriales bacterium]|nr:cadherin-like beta sandwich domain-containing protein [Eubacteriales bacterium]
MPKLKNKKKWAACLGGICLCTVLFIFLLIQDDISSATAVGEVQITSGYLNVRKGPGMKYNFLKSGGSKVTLSDGKQVTILAKNGKWYHVKFKLAGKSMTGYLHSAYVKVLTGSVRTYIPAKISAASVKLYKKPDESGTVVQLNGTKLKLAKKTSVKILSEKIVDNQKWYHVSAKNGTKKIKGYIRAKYAKITYKKGMPGKVYTTSSSQTLYKKAGKKKAVRLSGKDIVLSNNRQVTVLSEKKVGTLKYYKVSVRIKKKIVKGFLPEYAVKFQIVEREEPGVVPTEAPSTGTAGGSKSTATAKPNAKKTGNAKLTEAQFKKKMSQLGFPSAYITELVKLHKEYPSWEFEPYKTGLDWNAAVAAECKVGLNLLSNSKSPDWKSTADGAYDWTKDKYTVYDGTTWVTASKKAVEYYMDPRNFLDSRGIFQFELLEYQKDVQTQSGVENILKNTPMYNKKFNYTKTNGKTGQMKYSAAFIKAAASSGVSPYHLASRVKQEVVISPTMMSSSVSGNVSGYPGIYNFYNIGASNSAGGGAVANGLYWASTGTTYSRPWTDPYKSIVGGGKYIGNQYINVGQNTLYLQKFNVTSKNRYNHQYMSNIEAPNSEATKTVSAYGSNIADTPIVFSIPIYNNMPASACPIPSGGANPNNYLQTLYVSGYTFQSPFVLGDNGSKTYTVSVASTVTSININAAAVSSSATVSGTGVHSLAVGKNTFTVQVKAANGSVRNYKIEVTRGAVAAGKKAAKQETAKQDSKESDAKKADTPEEPKEKQDQQVNATAEPEKPKATVEPEQTHTPEE